MTLTMKRYEKELETFCKILKLNGKKSRRLKNDLVIGIIEEIHRSDTLLLDWDHRGLGGLPRRVESGLRIAEIRPLWIRYDRTKHGWHAVIRLRRDFSRAEIVALQAIAGSSWEREAMNFRRHLQMKKCPAPKFWRERFNVLYSRKLL